MSTIELLNSAVESALKAGEKILEVYHSSEFDVQTKDDNSPVTKADILADKIICEDLNKTNIPVLSEEGRNIPYEERKKWNRLWIVDPIDGTKEFIKKNGEFTVNIALVENQQPILGVIYVPVSGEVYFAEQSIGSFLVSNAKGKSAEEMMDEAKKLPLPNTRDKFTVLMSRSHASQQSKDYIAKLKEEHGEIDIIARGSSLKLCMVASGAADCYPKFGPTMEWDTAAGQAICKFAGKKIVNMKSGEDIKYNRENLVNQDFLAI